MEQYANIKLESDYNLLLKSGMFWVAYPELTGDWSKDIEVINPRQKTESRSTINLHLGDCLEAMREMPDNAFELAIVDPPYGMPKDSTHGRGKLKNRILNNGGVEGWDIAPKDEYFKEVMRVSKNQIIWGGNYFDLPPTRGFVIWDKEQPFDNFSAAEYAWMSFQVTSKIFRLAATRTGDGTKIHPTQKPVKLYEWLLTNYAKEGDKILDTHFGSGSHGIACGNLGFSIDAYELDEDYFNAAHKRIEQHFKQLNAFQAKPIINVFKP